MNTKHNRRSALKLMTSVIAIPFVGLRTSAAPERPMRSKPYIEMGRPEYEEPDDETWANMQCFMVRDFQPTMRFIVADDGFAHAVGLRPDEEWAQRGLSNAVTRINGPPPKGGWRQFGL